MVATQHVLAKRAAFVTALVAATFVLTMGVAGAGEVSEEVIPGTGVPSMTALIVLGAGFLIRPATAFLTTAAADSGFLGGLAGIALAALTAGGAALADVDNIGADWKSIVGVTLATALTAAIATIQLWAGKAVDWIHAKTDGLLGSEPAVTPAAKKKA